ncbi:hypothetical protein [Cupriavidus basilensis]|jgi:hypothetical protein|uniref:hypothetical protein n=1 Tax=Cupriavidus basilensis TaxID=68895 RepID=UPI0020A66A40|nr:hypothetical protein [Cupriavidus basilensis]MCP3024586.1 hypothetical protein [Cupriavidus basilensis]
MDLSNSRLGDCQPLDSLQTASIGICLTTDPRITHLEDTPITGAVIVYGRPAKQVWASQTAHPFADPATPFVRLQ